MKIAYLGPKGTHTERAAKLIAKKRNQSLEPILKPSPKAIAISVASGESEYGIIAYYNSTGGLVQQCLDAINRYNLQIIGSQRIAIDHSLGTYPKNKDFTNIYSHPQALAQCEDYLISNYPNSTPHRNPKHSSCSRKSKRIKIRNSNSKHKHTKTKRTRNYKRKRRRNPNRFFPHLKNN